MKFLDPTQPDRKFGSRLFLKKRRTSLNLTGQSRSEMLYPIKMVRKAG
jgi:hypothetical protein